jgi:hypothetical protein
VDVAGNADPPAASDEAIRARARQAHGDEPRLGLRKKSQGAPQNLRERTLAENLRRTG